MKYILSVLAIFCWLNIPAQNKNYTSQEINVNKHVEGSVLKHDDGNNEITIQLSNEISKFSSLLLSNGCNILLIQMAKIVC